MLMCAGREWRDDIFVDSRYRLSNRLPFHLFHGGRPSNSIPGFSFDDGDEEEEEEDEGEGEEVDGDEEDAEEEDDEGGESESDSEEEEDEDDDDEENEDSADEDVSSSRIRLFKRQRVGRRGNGGPGGGGWGGISGGGGEPFEAVTPFVGRYAPLFRPSGPAASSSQSTNTPNGKGRMEGERIGKIGDNEKGKEEEEGMSRESVTRELLRDVELLGDSDGEDGEESGGRGGGRSHSGGV